MQTSSNLYLLSGELSFAFGHAWPKTKTAAIKFQNNLEIQLSVFKNNGEMYFIKKTK